MLKHSKLLCLLLAAVFMGGIILSGCAGGGNTSSTTTQTEANNEQSNGNEQSTDATSEFVELTWCYPGDEDPDHDMVMEEANKIIKDNINAKLNFLMIPGGNFNDRMNVMNASGDTYDVAFTSSWRNSYDQNVAKGAFLPLDDLLDTYAPKLRAFIPDTFWDAARVNGEIYAVLNYQISTMTRGYIVRKDLADKYDLDPSQISEMKDLEPFLAKVKENEPGVYPYEGREGLWAWHQYSVGLLDDSTGGVYLDDQTCRIVDSTKTPEYKENLELARDWYTKGYIRSDVLSVKDVDAEKKAGKYAVMTSGNNKPGMLAEFKNKNGYEGVELTISDSVLTRDSVISTMNGISITSENPERAMMLLELINSDKELYNMVTFGLDGVHYEKDPNSDRITPFEGSSDKYSLSNWAIGTVLNAYLLPGQEDDVWDETHKMNMSGIPTPLMGFSFNPESVKNQITSISSVRDEYALALETGAIDPSEHLPKYQEKLKSAGLEEVIAEKQRQVDEWLDSKK